MVTWRRRRLEDIWYPMDDYEMCSVNTYWLARIYVDYTFYHCCDGRPLMYYPLLDNLTEWMDLTY